MTSDITAQLAALADQTDDQTRLDAIAACTHYCGQRTTAADAHAFALEQVSQLVSFEDGIFVEIRRGWRWLAGELEAIAALEATHAAEAAELIEADAAAEPEPVPKRRRLPLRRPWPRVRPEAQSEI